MNLLRNLGKIFKFVFGRDDAEFEKALKLAPPSWHIISSPQILGDGTIVIFPYENKLVKSAGQLSLAEVVRGRPADAGSRNTPGS